MNSTNKTTAPKFMHTSSIQTMNQCSKYSFDEYSGYIDDDQSHDCFMAYIEKMQLLSSILDDVKDLYDKLDTIDRYHVVNEDDDAIYSRDMRAFYDSNSKQCTQISRFRYIDT